jgi:hypothetical protein
VGQALQSIRDIKGQFPYGKSRFFDRPAGPQKNRQNPCDDQQALEINADLGAHPFARRAKSRKQRSDLHGYNDGNTAVGAAPAMTTTDHENDVLLRADALYAARSAMAETEPLRRRFGVAEIVQFLNDPGRSLSMEEQRLLFADPKLRTDYRRLKSQVAVAELPALAAASAGDVNTRRFEGGTVRIHPSRIPGQIYIVLQFSRSANSPRTILLENADGDIIKRSLPPADPSGEVMMVLDQKLAADAGFLRLISDPTSTGSFLL